MYLQIVDPNLQNGLDLKKEYSNVQASENDRDKERKEEILKLEKNDRKVVPRMQNHLLLLINRWCDGKWD